MTFFNASIPYSAESHEIFTDAGINSAIQKMPQPQKTTIRPLSNVLVSVSSSFTIHYNKILSGNNVKMQIAYVKLADQLLYLNKMQVPLTPTIY